MPIPRAAAYIGAPIRRGPRRPGRTRPSNPSHGSRILNETTERLIALQDLLQLKSDIEETSYEELGFEKPDVEAIETEIESLREEISPAVLRRYERIAGKYSRPLVPVRRGVCYGCFVRFPTARISELSEETPTTCESCGRLLYQIP
ncbi:MAG: hypothetical protein KY397_00395 [Gemmatimonadetes bacterium]|nr:hypothetical protein [Gemmatimonadota bacterium]